MTVTHSLPDYPVRIIMDSCSEVALQSDHPHITMTRVPFKIYIDDDELVDERLNRSELIDRMHLAKNKVQTACPSPQSFFDEMDPSAVNFVVTISSKLSGSYNSACLAKSMAEEKGFGENVYVFDSRSAVSGEDLTVLYIIEMLKRGFEPDDLFHMVRDYITHMSTYFILNSFDNLVKNGRIKHTVALVGKLLKINPIMKGVDGEIELKEKCRGHKKALFSLAKIIASEAESPQTKNLAITHVNAPETALKLRDAVEKTGIRFKNILILESGGLGTVYADQGGIVVAF
ncbi:DegV family protein [Pseudoramibacter porci]|uniref:DegV family protein n=1 Tax=Pseudoramibacter porci TaxID=2606631 RepID=A0A7X2NFV0_9FIRM|nr:DegV family protein [Pseudoramibacter porci]MSS19849.1 DegV family protein [Pseudoramibacter porci]